jgi:hypothetical protein
VLRAVMQGADGWLVQTTVHGEPVSRRCENWQSVERTLFSLRRQAHHAPPPRASAGPIAAMVAAVLILGVAATGFAQQPAADAAAVEQFTKAVQEYSVMHQRIENTLPPLRGTADVQAISNAIERVAGAIRVERRDARQGDLLNPAIARLFRERIASTLAEHDLTAADILAAEAAEGIDGPFVPLNVNDSFPWRYATAMLPCLIVALPALPAELQYRIVGYTLVLVDVHASLIVDLLPDALAATELR